MNHRSFVIAAGLVLAGIQVTALPGAAQDRKDNSARRALLVGVTKYPNLDERMHLKGPANDVLLMRDLLVGQFAFPKENVTVLSEAEGERDEKRFPNRAHIKREFDRLAQLAQPGDQIVILMGGHGSQQPEAENPVDPEPDGLDEIFLPRDVKQWAGEASKVPNAIIDDEIGAWLKAIQAKKAFVWIIFDSCHSGSMIRGEKESERQVDSRKDLKIPAAALLQAQERAAKRAPEGTRGGKPAPERNPLPQGGVVAVYACQSHEVTVERELPARSKDAKPYGLLTFSIVQILTQAQQNGNKPPSYQELVQLLNSRYNAMGRTAPTPQIEGGLDDRNREVLGTTSWTGRSRIILTKETRSWKINAGALHGISEGSILTVHPLADQKDADKVLGHVRVEAMQMATAVVVPCAYGATAQNDKLPEEARCTVAQLDFGVRKLRLGLDVKDKTSGLPADVQQQLAKDLTEAARQPGSMFEWTTTAADADWLLRGQDRKVFLLPAAEWSQDVKAASVGTRFGPFTMDADLPGILHERLQRIARAENLKKLVGASASAQPGKGTGTVDLDLSLLRLADTRDRKGTLLPLDRQPQLYHGDIVGIRVHNPNSFALDVTILYIDSGFGIDAYFPDPSRGEINRIRGGETLTVPTIDVDGSKTHGLENLIVIAIKARAKEPVDFGFLAQPTLEKATVKRGKSAKLPLELLLETGLYGSGDTRGISRVAIDDFLLRAVPWHLSADVRPKQKNNSTK